MNEPKLDKSQLKKHQEVAIDRMVDVVRRFVRLHKKQEASAQQGISLLDLEESFGTLGLFGPRGAGKTTVLEHVCDQLKAIGSIYLCPPLDSTTLAADVPLGFSLICHLRKSILNAQEGFSETDRVTRFKEACDRLLDAYLPFDQSYRELKLSLAVTASEYSEFALSRQKITEELDAWIRAATSCLGGKRHILIPLDDADLAAESFTSRVFTTFLHDFADSRLLFLLVADYDHLMLRFRTAEETGLKSGRDALASSTAERLLAKLIPIHHRVELQLWSVAELKSFQPAAQGNEHRDLSELIDMVARKAASGLRVRDFRLLLPQQPRGLTDFYRYLEQLDVEMDPPEAAPRKLGDRDLLVLLAQCRGEEELARKLALRPLDWWAARLSTTLDAAEGASWERVVVEAERDTPIWALEPGPSRPYGFPEGNDDALWMELLLNLACRQDERFLNAIFVQRFPPFGRRLERCGCEIELRRGGRLHRLLEDGRFLASSWLRWSTQAADREGASGAGEGKLRLRLGWSSLVGETVSYAAKLLAISRALGVPLPELEPGDARRHILPKDLRSLFLLTDRIARLPWVRIQDWAQDRQLSEELLLIVAILCGQAYCQIVDECLKREPSKSVAVIDLSSLVGETFADLKEQEVTDLRTKIEELGSGFRAEMKKLGIDVVKIDDAVHPIVYAATAYFKGAWFEHPAGKPAKK